MRDFLPCVMGGPSGEVREKSALERKVCETAEQYAPNAVGARQRAQERRRSERSKQRASRKARGAERAHERCRSGRKEITPPQEGEPKSSEILKLRGDTSRVENVERMREVQRGGERHQVDARTEVDSFPTSNAR